MVASSRASRPRTGRAGRGQQRGHGEDQPERGGGPDSGGAQAQRKDHPQPAVGGQLAPVHVEPAQAGQRAPAHRGDRQRHRGRAGDRHQRGVAAEQPARQRPGGQGQRHQHGGQQHRRGDRPAPDDRRRALAGRGTRGHQPGQLLLDREEHTEAEQVDDGPQH
jgi:hypothetical protein